MHTKTVEANIFNLVLDQFKDVTIVGLLVSVIVGFLIASMEDNPEAKIQSFIEPFIIFALLVINAITSVIFELKHRNVRKQIQSLNDWRVVLIKGGKEIPTTASKLNVGDIIRLRSGDRAPADVEIKEVFSNNIAYETVDKDGKLTTSSEKKGTVTRGAAILQGTFHAVVKVINGPRISVHAQTSAVPFVKQLDTYGKSASFVVLLCCALIFALNFTKVKQYNSVMKGVLSLSRISIALIIATLPEHLSIYLKTSQSIAAQKMLDANALCKEPSTIDTIGRITVLCGNLSSAFTSCVTKVAEFTTVSDDIVDVFSVTGDDYSTNGEIKQFDSNINLNEHKAFQQIAKGALLSSRLMLIKNGKTLGATSASYTNAALQVFAAKLIDRTPYNNLPKEDEIEFVNQLWDNFNQKYPLHFNKEFSRQTKMSVYSCGDTQFTLGAHDVVLKECEYYYDDSTGNVNKLSSKVRAKLEYQFKNWSSNYRVLCLSYEDNGKKVFISSIALINPLQDDAMSSVEECRNSNVRVIIVSGESAQTVAGYASKMRMKNTESISISKWTDASVEERKKFAVDYDIFVGFTENEKFELLKILQEQGEVVGVITGSVSDLTAMRAADIGISLMGASDCIQGGASLLLKDDSISALSAAVTLSKSTFKAAIGCINFIMTCAITMIVVSLFTALLKAPTFLSGSRILLIALLTFPFTSLIAMNVNQHSTKNRYTTLVNTSMYTRFALIGILGGIAAIIGALFVYLVDSPSHKHPIELVHVLHYADAPKSMRPILDHPAAPTLATLIVLLVHVANAFDGLLQNEFDFKKDIVSTAVLISSVVIFLIITEVPFLSHLFDVCHLSLKRWIIGFLLTSPVVLANAIFTFLSRRKN